MEIYPRLPENAEKWRLKSCFQFGERYRSNDITSNIVVNFIKIKNRLKKLRFASNILTGSATALSISGTAISATVVGVIVGGPIVGVGTIVGVFSLITLKMEKDLLKEIIKNEKLLSLIYYKIFFNKKIYESKL